MCKRESTLHVYFLQYSVSLNSPGEISPVKLLEFLDVSEEIDILAFQYLNTSVLLMIKFSRGNFPWKDF